MTKIALLLTGQLRTFDMVKYLHMNALVSKYDTDVFLGIDLCNAHQCEFKNKTEKTHESLVSKCTEFFKPINTFILDDFLEEFNKIKKCSKHAIHFELLFRQYYVVKNTYQLLINHMQQTNTNYDIIIRLRFDQYLYSNEVHLLTEIWDSEVNTIKYNKHNTQLLDDLTKDSKFVFNIINDNDLNVFGFGDYINLYKYANDQFFYHNQSLIFKMHDFYDNMIELMNMCFASNIGQYGALIETMFYLYLTNNNINIKYSNIHGFFIREI